MRRNNPKLQSKWIPTNTLNLTIRLGLKPQLLTYLEDFDV